MRPARAFVRKLLRAALISGAALLVGCNITAPPRDTGQFQATVWDVVITWRYVNPDALRTEAGAVGGHTTWGPGNRSCVVDLDASASRFKFTQVVAHEAGHCFQARYLLPGISRPDLGDYFSNPLEGFAETYALAYLAACGDSLSPLGWRDFRVPFCAEAPDPREVSAAWP